MTLRGKMFLAFLMVPFALYAFYKWNYPTFSWNQRIAVEVMVDGELVSGSSVTASQVYFSPNWLLSSNSRHPSIEGEAVVVDLGERGYLFALLRSEGSVDYAKSVAIRQYREIFYTPAGTRLGRGNMVWSPYNTLARQRDVRELPHEDYPMLVTFADINDPTSVQLVDPDDLAASFGEGVELKRITLVVTGDWVTEGIEDVLGWLANLNTNLDGERTTSSNRVTNILNNGDFKRSRQ